MYQKYKHAGDVNPAREELVEEAGSKSTNELFDELQAIAAKREPRWKGWFLTIDDNRNAYRVNAERALLIKNDNEYTPLVADESTTRSVLEQLWVHEALEFAKKQR